MKTIIKPGESILSGYREILMFTSKLSNAKYSKLGHIP